MQSRIYGIIYSDAKDAMQRKAAGVRLALAHDWLNQYGGAEDVLEALADIYPASPVYTSLYAPDRLPQQYRDWDIRALWSDRLPAIRRRHQAYLPVYPLAWQSLNLRDYDVVLSNKSGFCHGLRAADSLHICYCLTPTRYVWQLEHYLQGEAIGALAKAIARPVACTLRGWDFKAAQRVTHFIAISSAIQRRIKRFYNRDSHIIFPPVDTARFRPVPESQIEDYFLVVSRLIPYKRIDLAIRAASELGVPLKVAGSGRDLPRLRSLASDSVEFLGYVPDAELPGLMARCKAFIFPGLEDFGITTVQAAAAGRPVIAFKGGGALDTVIAGVTGAYFETQDVASVKAAMRTFDASHYDSDRIRRHALSFDVAVFKRELSGFVDAAWRAHNEKREFRWDGAALAQES